METHQGHSKSARTLELSKENRERIAAFLVAINKPLNKTNDVALSASPSIEVKQYAEAGYDALVPSRTKPRHTCKHCGSSELEIRYAYTYFFFCLKCEKNTPIKAECPGCQEPAKLRKHKKEFFIECDKHQHSNLYYVNP